MEAVGAEQEDFAGLERRPLAHVRDDLGLVLKVSIHQHNDIAIGMVERGAQRRLVTEVTGEDHQANPAIRPHGFLQQPARLVRAAVVHQYHVVRAAGNDVEHGHEPGQQFRNHFLLVVDGNAYREAHDFPRP